LLLSQSLLPLVFSLAAGLRRARRGSNLQRRDALSVSAAKPSSLLFYLSLIVLAFLWWDAIVAFRFPNGFGIGLGTIVLCVNAFILSLFSFSCNSCRHVCGGYLNSFHSAPGKYKTWSFISRLNEKHMQYAWVSL